MAWLEKTFVRWGQKQDPMRFEWLTLLAENAPGSVWKFLGLAPLMSYKRKASLTQLNVARLATMRAEDCGVCLQITVDQAVKSGMDQNLIQAALAGGANLPPDEKLIYDFAKAVTLRLPDANDLADQVEERYGKEIHTELSLAVATVLFFPKAKRGLGILKTCQAVQVRVGS